MSKFLEERVQVLEQEVKELKLVVSKLRESNSVTVSADFKLGSIKASDFNIYKEKSPNQQRKEIIEKAKLFIEEIKDSFGDYNFVHKKGGYITCSVEFLVNKDKRKVVALMRGCASGKVRANGTAICMKEDVFNEDIGKAIALGKVLGVDVSKFKNAVQPNEVVVGQFVEIKGNYEGTYKDYIIDGTDMCYNSIANIRERNRDGRTSRIVTILDDTNAIYE